jgi:uncharacterized protein YndB with AHSA1/START domain
MSPGPDPLSADSPSLTLVVRRTIPATAEFLFQAWTQPTSLINWWGPSGVKCVEAHVDLRVGGVYRIANQFPDGKIIWITGKYECVEFPRKLMYTWRVEGVSGPIERVTVEFESRNEATEVIVTHERIAESRVRDEHEVGWNGCLDGLASYVRSSSSLSPSGKQS